MHYQFEDTLAARDCKRHIPHPFGVPADSGQVDIHLHFTPAKVDGIQNMLTLTLFDAQGFRGAGHRGGNSHAVRITSAAATPGYMAGALPAGEWIAHAEDPVAVRTRLARSSFRVRRARRQDDRR